MIENTAPAEVKNSANPVVNAENPNSVASIISNTTSMPVYAGFWRRFVAVLIDGFLIGIATGIIGSIIGVLINILISQSDRSTVMTQLIQLITQGISYLISAVYYIYFTGKKGQTLGKMAMHIKVISIKTQAPPGYVNAFLRETIGKFVSGIILALGYITMIWDKQKQTWHDKIADTIVVRI